MLSDTAAAAPPTPSATPSPASRASANPARLIVTCIGAGYVGGPSMAVLALRCPDVDVFVADLSAPRIAAWQSDNLPIYEPGLLETVRKVRAGARNLHFTTDVSGAIARAHVVYVAVNTPTKVKGEGAGHAPDLRYIESATRMIARATPANKHLIVVEKSTVPCRTAETVRAILTANAADGATFEVLSNPEFLAEGTAIKDLLQPDRVLVGCLPTPSGAQALSVLADLYAKWIPRERIVPMNLWSSELAKLAANAMLAQRITSINTLSAVCERTGADVSELARAVGLDTRIGGKFLGAGVGYGGSCFKKDVLALSYLADALGLPEVGAYWRGVDDMNEWQKRRFARNVVKRLHGTVAGKRIAMLGYAFKADTGDTRESPATNVAVHLLADGAHVHIYDPKADREHVLYELRHAGVDDHTLAEQVEFVSGAAGSEGAYVACAGASAVVICTAWAEFKSLDWARIYASMPDKPAFVFDGRLCLDHAALRSIGFTVDCVGKPDPCMLEDPAAKEMRAAAVKAAPIVDVERVVDQVVLKSAPASPNKLSQRVAIIKSQPASPIKHRNGAVLARGDSVLGAASP